MTKEDSEQEKNSILGEEYQKDTPLDIIDEVKNWIEAIYTSTN